MTKSENKIFLFLCCSLAASIVFIFILGLSLIGTEAARQEHRILETKTKTTTEYIYEEFFTRKNINELLKKNEEVYFSVLGFYADETKSTDVAIAILDYAIENEVPLHLAFSIAYVESSYDIEAVNDSNTNNTIDRGLFQLNSSSFSSDVDWFNPRESANLGTLYLRNRYENNDSWEVSVMMYNAGRASNVGNHTMRYLSRVLNKERQLDERFNNFLRNIDIDELEY